MKAPLRFAFGWVLFLAIFMALRPVMAVIWWEAREQPALAVSTAVLGLFLFILLYTGLVRRFWAWCDAPRRNPASGESQ